MRAIIYLMSIDILAIAVGFSAAVLLRSHLLPGSNWLITLGVIIPVFVTIAGNSHAYSASTFQDTSRAVAKGAQALLLAICAVIFVAYCLRVSEIFPRLIIAMGSIVSMMLLVIGRYFAVRNLSMLVGGNPFKVVLIHDGDAPLPAGDFSVLIASNGYFDPDRHDPVMYDRLATALAGADRVVVACPQERRIAWAHALKGANVLSEIALPELEPLAPLGRTHGRTPTVVVANGALGLADRLLKRSFDLAVASAALTFFAPLLAIVALLIKLESRGPVFFRQTRIGRGNQMFQMIKFRSMHVQNCDGTGARSTVRNDDRITRTGNFIRGSSIDELPQLLNVLGGSMSIVGPRPHALGSRAANKLFWEVDERYWHRHAAKPGLTGLAQVRGFRGATLIEDDLRNRLQADLEYLDTWSIWRDLKIIALTFKVLSHRNAF